jgi:hypothetical protein
MLKPIAQPGTVRQIEYQLIQLTTIETTPTFAIGQRAILACTPAGNVL